MKFESPEALRLAVAKTKCVKDTLFFTRYFFKNQYGRKFVIGRHHEVIAEALDRVFRGECRKLIINVPPRYGKTELAVKSFIAKGLGVNPKAKFIHLSYSDKLALDNSETVKDIVKSEAYGAMFPEVQIKPGTDSKEKWYTTEGGGVYAAAAGGQITGFGAGIVDEEQPTNAQTVEIEDDWFAQTEGFGGAIVIDDPIKPEDAQSETKRTQVNDRYDSTIVNRVNSRKTPIIIIMQRTHTEDLSGHVMEKYKGFEVISLPAINKDGTPLWPHKHTIEELREQEQANEFVFDTQMMQDPRPKHGSLFPKKELRRFRPDPRLIFETTSGYIDVADEGDDYLCMPVGRTIGPDIYITEVVFNQLNTDHTIDMCAEVINRLDMQYCTVEANNQGTPFKRDLQDLCQNCSVYGQVSTTNKLTRIHMAAGFIKKRCLFLEDKYQSDEYREFFKNVTGFTKNGEVKHDDGPDALSGLINFIKSYYPELFMPEAKEEQDEEKTTPQ